MKKTITTTHVSEWKDLSDLFTTILYVEHNADRNYNGRVIYLSDEDSKRYGEAVRALSASICIFANNFQLESTLGSVFPFVYKANYAFAVCPGSLNGYPTENGKVTIVYKFEQEVCND